MMMSDNLVLMTFITEKREHSGVITMNYYRLQKCKLYVYVLTQVS